MKNIRKLIKEHFEPKPIPDPDEQAEDSLVKSTIDDITEGKIESVPYNDDFKVFSFKSKTFPADGKLSSEVYGGKTVSRKSLGYDNNLNLDSESYSNDYLSSDGEEKNSDSDSPTSTEESDTNGSISEYDSDDAPSQSKKPTKRKLCKNANLGTSQPSDEEITSDDGTGNENESKDQSLILYSKAFREENSDSDKGVAVRNQLNLWEILLEARITLQKCLSASNQLPKFDKYEEIWSTLPCDDKNTVVECREKVWDLLEKLINLQNTIRNQCPEYSASRDTSAEKEETEVSFNSDITKIKRRKLSEYPKILEKKYDDYTGYRNAAIQKWNDKTKIASGKFAKSNFSAFDQPILKQIEQITSDKHRLIRRTCIKRSQYNIIGETAKNSTQVENNPDSQPDVDVEIFDDDDFYHKLLRDYIAKKTADISDPTRMGKKWTQLQSLRNKMKRKIDARRTKGRKIKYDVHPKLVNFMAPIVTNQCEDRILNELCNSIFGKNSTNT